MEVEVDVVQTNQSLEQPLATSMSHPALVVEEVVQEVVMVEDVWCSM